MRGSKHKDVRKNMYRKKEENLKFSPMTHWPAQNINTYKKLFQGAKLATPKCPWLVACVSWNKQGQKDSRRNFDLSSNCLKNLDRGFIPERELSLELVAVV